MKHLLSFITLLLLSTLAFCQVPNSFSSGETISSSKINANFSFLANAMGSGNVTAMMHCTGNTGVIDEGYPNRMTSEKYENSKIVYSYCHSTDNTTFQPSHSGCVLKGFQHDDGVGGFYCQSSYARTFKSFITAEKLLEEKWILAQIINYEDTVSFKVFYKVSSD